MTAQARLNALVQTLDQRAATLDTMIALGGGLAMDEPAYAQDLKLHSKGVVTHRRYLEHDDELYMRWTPDAWLNVVAADGANGVLCQCGNEPVIDASNVVAFVSWNVQALTKAHARGVYLGVGCFSVGNPKETLISSGAFDKLLLALTEKDALIVHEYFVNHPTDPSEESYLCGRVEWWLERMQFLHCACKTVIIGEYGRDLGGGLNDGWRGQGWSIEDYTARCVEGIEGIYQPLSDKYRVNVFVETFCMGRGFGNRWQSWNVEGETYLAHAYQTWNTGHPLVTQPPTVNVPANPGVGIPSTVKISKLHYRTDANGADLGYLTLNEQVTTFPDTLKTVDGSLYQWVFLYRANGAPGWAAPKALDGTAWIAPNTPTEINRVVIPKVPYSSQFGWQSGWTALCGETCIYMALEYDRLLKHVLLPPEITPYSMALYLGKGAHDFSSLVELEKAGDAYGADVGPITPTADPFGVIVRCVNNRQLLIPLIDYSKLPSRWDQGFSGNHILVITGYSDQSVICHDPDSPDALHGAYISYARADFLAAWASLGSTALVTT